MEAAADSVRARLEGEGRGGLHGRGRAERQQAEHAEERARLLGDGGRAARVADAEDGVHAARAEELEGSARHGEEALVDGGGRVGGPVESGASPTRVEERGFHAEAHATPSRIQDEWQLARTPSTTMLPLSVYGL